MMFRRTGGPGLPELATRAVIGTLRPTEQRRATSLLGQFCARVTGADGAEGNRTPDLCSAIAALSQLSYSPAPEAVKRCIASSAHGNGPASGAAVIALQSTN